MRCRKITYLSTLVAWRGFLAAKIGWQAFGGDPCRISYVLRRTLGRRRAAQKIGHHQNCFIVPGCLLHVRSDSHVRSAVISVKRSGANGGSRMDLAAMPVGPSPAP